MPKSFSPKYVRNFSIIAHIDHGKSTLADRFLEITGAVDIRKKKDQQLDSMDIERERGITIKAAAVSLTTVINGEEYLLNLIDTPGHVDFAYEVEKSLQACEGALLLIDAAQGIQAQTVANAMLAMEQDMAVIPVFNKVDLPHSRPDEFASELENTLLLEPELALHCSAKTGTGVNEIKEELEAKPELELPENVEKLVSFMKETGGNIEDYVRLNADYSNVDDYTLIREYYKQTKPHLDTEDVNVILEDFDYDKD